MTTAPRAPVALLLVSHSKRLAEAAAQLARQMTGESVTMLCPSGSGEDGSELGTDALRIADALAAADRPAGTLILMDLGSAILSAQTALDLVDPQVKARARLIGAPFVEGVVAAAVSAAAGMSLEQVATEASRALEPKLAQVGELVPAASVEAEAGATTEPSRQAEAVIADPHGLHARPAARLVGAAAGFAADLTIADLDNGKGPVSARSLVGLGSLGATVNHRLRVVGRGADAERAVAALAELISTFSGDAQDLNVEERPAVLAEGRAVPVSPGVAIGRLVALSPPPPRIPDTPAGDVESECGRLREAVDFVRGELARAGGARAAGADILAVQAVFLSDPELIGAAETRIRREKRNAADAFARAGEAAASVFAGLEDPVLRARAVDLRDATGAVLRRLLGAGRPELPGGEPAILVATDLPPSLVHAMDQARVLGVIDRRGGATSHSAILLRGLGIPAVAGAGPLLPDDLPSVAALDGSTGEIILAPSAEQRLAFEARRARAAEARAGAAAALRDGLVKTPDGREIELWANVTGVADAKAARAAGAFGIGLLRTEIMFLDRDDPPSEEEQASALRPIFEVFAGRPITVRTLDAGGDKPIPYLRMPREDNPFLGVRGLRLSLRELPVFETQLRAILRAGYGQRIEIMLPMVTDAEEVVAARAALERAHAALSSAGIAHAWPAPLGVMVEVPAAALEASALAQVADFFSIGTNDLTQYALAAERGHPDLAKFARASHPAVLRLIAGVAAAGRAAGRHVAVCGEAAGDPAVAPLFVAAGVRALSMSAGMLPGVAAALAGVS